MARRQDRGGLLKEEERPTSGPMSLAGFIRPEGGRRKNSNRIWRPFQLSDLGDEDSDDSSNDVEEIDVEKDPVASYKINRRSTNDSIRATAAPFHPKAFLTTLLQASTTGKQKSEKPPRLLNPEAAPVVFAKKSTEAPGLTDAGRDIKEEYIRVFGKPLPNPISLSGSLGEFDGQVKFIGHPNHDVSAHQWSAESYQWVNIGLYSHSRGRIEGSLASDRLQASLVRFNSVEYFKTVADLRQRPGQMRPQFENTQTASQPCSQKSTDHHRHSLFETPYFDSSSSSAGPSQDSPSLNNTTNQHAGSNYESTRADLGMIKIGSNLLEDPFVASKDDQFNTRTEMARTFYSSDISKSDWNTIFPTISAPRVADTTYPALGSFAELEKQNFMRDEQRRIDAMRFNISSAGRASDHTWLNSTLSHNEAPQRQTTEGPFPLSGVQNSHLPITRPTVNSNLTVPDFFTHDHRTSVSKSQPTAGYTIANPHRNNSSNLNAKAAPYISKSALLESSDEFAADIQALSNETAKRNGYSNLERPLPDANILRGWPTSQNWNGPFFMGDTPDNCISPTPVSKIRYDERGERLQAASAALMATAYAEMKYRRHQAGTIPTNDGTRFEDTPVFVRLHDNLLPYVQENRSSRARDYFTSAWDSRNGFQMDGRRYGNDRFFSEGWLGSPLPASDLNSNHRSLNVDSWNDRPMFNSLSCHHPSVIGSERANMRAPRIR
ncbi:hypothetical protein BU24DRAFT_457842 [Aaosphaeria arxii CBS 175.79]|uniref:Uncharacterized protein n=1 Tax=Aaosphaeria arxii CBS 175.79 TaxID=1450172 RepID=A0A6A5Y9M1_9PLEO|nr:uncharacterized protein BU24DRAFT_457842 [Aaosphaeria arxii CBS 175.79]KAF2021923.1 hypothetical protein BU24DRAFT_457842 [Aaosphaeria arxii CBS 175.79]